MANPLNRESTESVSRVQGAYFVCGSGHDSIAATIVQAFWEMSIPPEKAVKFSGIGCSSKTPAYFISGAHGFNAVHGRMPSVATGAQAGNRNLICIGVSGDGGDMLMQFLSA